MVNSPRASMRLVRSEDRAPDSQALVRALARGERWAQELLWEQHSPMVFRLMERGLGPRGDAEDLTQEVFLQVYSKIGTLRKPDALRSFIYSVALRQMKWELRRRRVRKFLTLSSTGEVPDVAVRGVSSEVRQILSRFYEVLDQLSVSERTAFILRHLEGMTIKEGAAAMEVSTATFKRRLRDAAERVSELVESDGALSSYWMEQEGNRVAQS